MDEKDKKKWTNCGRLISDQQKLKIVGRVVETAVLVCMGTHPYSFGDKLMVQQEGGPIGMRFTASLANLIMKMWDRAWYKLMEREGITHYLFLRYVDDVRLILPSLKKGWFWDGENFSYSELQRQKDEVSGVSNEHRTTVEVTKAMSSILYFLQFTGEDGSMYNDGKLPTLDTALWISNGKISYTFYEKPTVGNQVLRRDTALPTASIRSTLLQETVRRLLNCSVGTEVKTTQTILSTYAQKLVNSGHSQLSTKIFIIQGITKYLHKVRLSKLPKDNECYQPLYLSKSFNEEQRQINKYLDGVVPWKQ